MTEQEDHQIPETDDPDFVGAIVAMSAERVIGVDGTMPWHYSADLKRFKRLTLGSSIIMGRKTWDAIGRRALPGRTNVVISRSPVDDVTHYSSLKQAMTDSPGPIWIIGGAQIYTMALPMCHMLDITWVPDRVDNPSAVRFPDLPCSQWRAGPREPLEDDERLVNQRFYRRNVNL